VKPNYPAANCSRCGGTFLLFGLLVPFSCLSAGDTQLRASF
jgi:hypothetical protein